MALTKNQIENVTNHYAREYDLRENLLDLEKCVEQHGHNCFYIYRKICQIKSWLILSEEKNIQ